MGNFLDNLVARTLHLREPVRPRLASLFEPATLAGAPALSFAPEQEQPASVSPLAAPSTVIAPAPTADAARFEADARPGVEPTARASSTPRTVDSAGEPGDARQEVRVFKAAPTLEEAAPGQKSTPRSEPRDAAAEARAERRERAEPLPRAEVLRHESAAPAGTRGRVDETSGAEEAVRSLRERVAALESSMSEDRRRQETVVPAPSVGASATPRAADTFAPRVERAAPARAFERKAETPHINVTIGRVDVRAVQQQVPVAPQRAPRREQTSTLEEYLRKREGGRR